MRKYICLVCILLVLGVTSCKEFLNVTPKNVISMEDLQSVKQALSRFLYAMPVDGTGYNVGENSALPPFGCYYEYKAMVLYSGDWDLSTLAEDKEGMTVEDVEQADWRSEYTQSYWRKHYRPIGLMNLFLYEAATAAGDEDMRDYVMGEAYVMRAYCFFKLIQYFAPYDNNELGIPLCLNSYDDFENVNLSRVSQTEVYAQILRDLHEAEIRLARTPMRSSFNRMYDTPIVNRLFAQVYHFKALSPAAEADDWKNAALYASKETEGAVLESDPDKLSDLFNVDKRNSSIVTNEAALRVVMASSCTMDHYALFGGMYIRNDFVNTYFPTLEGDIRRDYCFTGSTSIQLNKFSTYWGMSGNVFVGFRLAEAFLIQAEALAMTDQLDEAKAILERFKEARYTGVYTTPSDKEGLLQDIYRERRKEFVGEGDYVWMDMKRLGVKAECTVDGKTYTLNGAGDYRYTFPIPTSELETNKFIDQNPGWHLTE